MTQETINTTVAFLHEKGFQKPQVGIVLGTGLGQLVNHLEIEVEINYTDIPNFPVSTVEFHSGKLLYGTLEGKKTIVMQGRFHLYEGYTLQEITFPVRVLKALGITSLLVSNAAGAINLSYKKGDLMLLDDHINLQGGSPLAFKNVSVFGERFTDMCAPYDATLNEKMLAIAKENNIVLHKGIYASVVGPQLETRSEYRYLKIIGADAVGMSTVPEVIVANHLQLPVIAVSVLTDECDPDNLKPVNIPEIIAVAGEAEPKMITLFKTLVSQL
ncbi:purine-nucleoside phosphorylase [Flavobacterium sp. F-380]|uniref:Purine nucleoside phosphorylase n=1 Tax=Flavobacterium kayseriense TaxID=2764714 RepID=A0ABR7J7X0_9FLAO|nr:purine-nucleoside phosphorylase [Flavobacterium kayseriense]MBC5841638.1 purine-nucleoside phosphorylase [Flavobacterium kayseriense]MBC5848166.1 purine-nucleoside phosphorylase [Flavobacterium kayseriense]